MGAVLGGIVGYCFLIFIPRIVGRRPGKQIMSIGITHFVIAWLKQICKTTKYWRWLRDQGLKSLEEFDYTILECNGEISFIPKEQ